MKIRESKFGPALVVECAECCGGYVLGFRIDPKEKLQSIHKELLSLQKVYGQVPFFGVQFKVGEQVSMKAAHVFHYQHFKKRHKYFVLSCKIFSKYGYSQ